MNPKVDPGTQAELVALGQRLRDAREKRGLSQLKLAESIGIDRSNLIRIEKGRMNITIETLLRIANALDADASIKLVLRRRRRPTTDAAPAV